MVYCRWFDSSRSLMEQGVVENSLVLLKYKFYAFYDLNPKVSSSKFSASFHQICKYSPVLVEI